MVSDESWSLQAAQINSLCWWMESTHCWAPHNSQNVLGLIFCSAQFWAEETFCVMTFSAAVILKCQKQKHHATRNQTGSQHLQMSRVQASPGGTNNLTKTNHKIIESWMLERPLRSSSLTTNPSHHANETHPSVPQLLLFYWTAPWIVILGSLFPYLAKCHWKICKNFRWSFYLHTCGSINAPKFLYVCYGKE